MDFLYRRTVNRSERWAEQLSPTHFTNRAVSPSAVPHRRPAKLTRSPSPPCRPEQRKSYVPRIEYKQKQTLERRGEKFVVLQHAKQAATEMTNTRTLKQIPDDVATISAEAMVVAADKASDIAQSQEP